jgi:hypothetical protein
LVDLKEKTDIDLYDLFNITYAVNMIFDREEECFYILSNRQSSSIGFFLVKFFAVNPGKYKFITMWRHLLEVGDANMSISKGMDSHGVWYKELIVGYKTIFINTYNIVVIDLAKDGEKMGTLQRFESFQLWESKCSSILLHNNEFYITFSNRGMNVVALGASEKYKLKDCNGDNRMIHSLESLSFLKLEPINFINFKF